MKLIDHIQKLPQAKKLAIIWTVVTIVFVLMILVWVISAKFQKNVAPDTSLFRAIGQGVHNVRENYGK